MQLQPDFVPKPGADGWQLSNPPILALAPLRASLELFDEATMPVLRARSEELTGTFVDVLSALPSSRCELITPRDASQRGCQVSLRIPDRPREVQQALQAAGIICDFREPDVIRAAPVPLYNTIEEVRSFVQILASV
jgi:kynureninase